MSFAFFRLPPPPSSCFFFFNDTATTEIYTLSLHDALPIYERFGPAAPAWPRDWNIRKMKDRKSTRLNSSHLVISYAVFCLKKKKKNQNTPLLVSRLSLFKLCSG